MNPFPSNAARRLGVLVVAVASVVASFAVRADAANGHDPNGRSGAVRVRGGVAHLRGWASDPDTSNAIRVQLTIDGRPTTSVRADRRRAAAAGHGWRAAVTIPQGRHRLCTIARNVGRGADRRLRCWWVRADYRAPGEPTGLRATRTDHSITLRWRAPARHGGGVLHAYRVRAVDPAGHVTHARAPGTARGATLTGLKAARRYEVSVRAANAAYRSAPAAIEVTTAYPPIPRQTTPAPVARSHYLRRLTGAAGHDERLMQRMGAADAARNPRGHRYLILQDIGAQTRGGVLLSATITFLTYADLRDALESYIVGYSSTQQFNAPVVVAVGTNNDGAVSRRQGAVWAQQVIAPLATWARRHTERITVVGADDIEPGFSAGIRATRAWLSGFLSAGSADFVFNGSADGCPTERGSSACYNKWSTGALHWLAGAADPPRVLALPQIYNTTMPWQWQVIAGVHHGGLRFAGPLTEHRACAQAPSCQSMTNPRAWQLLYNALASDPVTAVRAMPYGPDLGIS